MKLSFNDPLLQHDHFVLIPEPEVNCLKQFGWFESECVKHPFTDKINNVTAYFVPRFWLEMMIDEDYPPLTFEETGIPFNEP
ncbi:hypothetical protein [Hufsiella ginkgonis]|uniref:Uncharacterized protein n=1 Tax=Hufsiella ginkgonis TaxID=2695274 RepID=A0A7K1Y363_9SPHI|nr:hypothetical protein [Hufsiella ginkgonis]MXV17725.1 hypothetical protein [Hufsiella ginkgonis]